MTNWEKYFGTPEATVEMSVEPYVDALSRAQMVRVTRGDEVVAVVKSRYYGVWLKQEADHGHDD